jgi:hypothetical protein
MKKLLISLGILLMPLVAGAAYNDVSLTSSAIISVGGMTLNVDGDSSVVQSITVNDSTFSIDMDADSVFSVTSADKYTFSSDAPTANITANQCGDVSRLSLMATSSRTIVITPSTSVCGVVVGSSAGGSSTGGSAGGGGGSGISGTAKITPNAVAPAAVTTATTVAQLQAMITSLMAQIAALGGTPAVTSGTGFTFTKNLTVGSKSTDVTNLQKVLNSDPDTQIASSGAGSPGNETTYFGSLTKIAIQKFQVKYGLATPGGVGYGNFGPKTKAKMAEVSKLKGL